VDAISCDVQARMKSGLRRAVTCLLVLLFCISPAWPWGNEGHSAINRVAAEKLPADVPSFFRNAAAQLAYLAPEPDRWRQTSELALKRSQEPEHYINLERVEGMTLPPDRFSFYQALDAKRRQTPGHPEYLLPEKVGLQPYVTIEVFERLVVAFREVRQANAQHRDPAFAEANAIFYAGWLGHYVGDGANPMHTTIQHNGWVGPNPKGYTTANTVHWKMEGIFIAANQQLLQRFADLVPAQPTLLKDPFQDYLRYLYDSYKYVETAYQLEKDGGFDGEGTPASRDFLRHRLAAGAAMLRDLWYTAWMQSGEGFAANTAAPTATQAPAAPMHLR
jgi:hypothetical protein